MLTCLGSKHVSFAPRGISVNLVKTLRRAANTAVIRRDPQRAGGQAACLAETLSASACTENHLSSNQNLTLTVLSLLGLLGAPETAEELLVSVVFYS